MTFAYGKDQLTIEKAVGLCAGTIQGELLPDVLEKVDRCRRHVDQLVEKGDPAYGINTGFGPLLDQSIDQIDILQLQVNLLRSHAVGTGTPIDKNKSKLMLICKIHALAQGHSGIHPNTLKRMVQMVEQDIVPVVPSQGSVGASGDLIPLAHLFLPLIGEGQLWDDQQPVEPALALGAKEGLALVNGTQFMLAHAVSGLDRVQYLLTLADLIGATTGRAIQASKQAFDPALHQLRPHPGALESAKNITKHLTGGDAYQSLELQNPYSVRCMPQVHGASRDAVRHLNDLVEIELNAVTDNPVFTVEGTLLSGGNFHGQPLAMAMDYCTVAMSELGNISERRSYLLLDGKYGLPKLLVEDSGLNSGMMIPQYTAAALVSENKSLCFPASADSIPTALGQEDHVSMGSISGRKLHQVMDNLEVILGIELLSAVQALEFRKPAKFSKGVEGVYNLVREQIPVLTTDRYLKGDLDVVKELIRTRTIVI